MGLYLLGHLFPSIQLFVLVHMTFTHSHRADEPCKPTTYVHDTPLGLKGWFNLFTIRPPSLDQYSEAMVAHTGPLVDYSAAPSIPLALFTQISFTPTAQ